MDEAAIANAQAKCDAVEMIHGTQAPRALQGESLRDYRVRLLRRHQAHSPAWKSVNLNVMANDAAAFDVAETQILRDSLHVATHPTNAPGSPLVAHTRVDGSGRRITTFSGDPIEAWKPFMGAGVRYLTAINRNPAGAGNGS